MSNKKFVSKIDFGKKIKAAADEHEIVNKYNKDVWLIENLNRLSDEYINLDELSEEDRFYVRLTDKYVIDKGGWLKEFNKQHEVRNKIALKQVEVDYTGKVVTNEERTKEIIKSENEINPDIHELKGLVVRTFLVILTGVLTFNFFKQWFTIGFDKIDRGLAVVPIVWAFFILLAVLANEEYLNKIGLGFISKSIKYIFVIGVLIFVISFLSQCADLGGGDFKGIPDNVRM